MKYLNLFEALIEVPLFLVHPDNGCLYIRRFKDAREMHRKNLDHVNPGILKFFCSDVREDVKNDVS